MLHRVLRVGIAAAVISAGLPLYGSAFAQAATIPTYVRDIAGPGLADVYPADVAATDTHYLVLDAGRYRVVSVDRATGAISDEVGGKQGEAAGEFGAARAITVDSAGNVYVADTATNRIQKFDPALDFVTKWGSFGTGNGQFKLPYGIAAGQGLGAGGAPAEVLYVTDDTGRVQKFDLDGNYIGSFGAAVLDRPRQLTVHPANGRIYVIDGATKEVVVFDDAGTEKFRFGGAGTADGQFREDPRGISITADGLVYVSDDGNRRIQVFNSAGIFQFKFAQAGTPGALTDPRGIATTSDGKVIVGDLWNYSLKEYDAADGTFIRKLFGNGPPVGGFNTPRGIDVDESGRLFGTDWWNQRIQRVDADGTNPIAWGFRGNRRQKGSINFAWDVAVEPGTNRAFVANRESHEIEVFEADGTFVGRWGTLGSLHGEFRFPQGVAFAPNGDLVVSDSGNHRIERFSIAPDGTATYVDSYGSFGLPSAGPGRFNTPAGLDVAPDGTIWVADTRNSQVQKRSPDGTWTVFKTFPMAGTTTSFAAPWGVTVAPDGSIWVADSAKDRIVKMSPSGAVDFAVNGTKLGSGALDGPHDIAFGTTGEIYVSDAWNNRIIELAGGPIPPPPTPTPTPTSTDPPPPPVGEMAYERTIGGPGLSEIYPSGLEVDRAGNVYVADTGNDQIVKYAAGTTTPEWRVGQRGLPMSEGSFSNPRDIAVSPTNLYVADMDNQAVQILGLDGSYVGKLNFNFKGPIGVTVGNNGAGAERILVSDGVTGNVEIFDSAGTHVMSIPPKNGVTSGTRDAATDSDGNIYIADYRFDKIQKYNAVGTWVSAWGGSTAPTCQQIPRPYGVAVDDQDRIYVASSKINRSRAFYPDGSCVEGGTYGVPGEGEFKLSQNRRVAVGTGSTPLVYNADLWGTKILAYNFDGSLAFKLGSWPKPAPGGLNEAHGVAVSDSYVFSMDTVNQRFQRFNLDGSAPEAWGDKGTGGGAQFNWAQGIGYNPVTGNVWIADTRNSRLVEFGSDGSGPLRTLGRLGGAPGLLNWPMSISFDPAGNLYVADTYNHRIQSFAPDLSLRWAHGTVGTGSENLKKPWGVGYDAAGDRVLVADTMNNRIVALNPSTGATTKVFPIPRGTVPGKILNPEGVAATADGSIWVSDTGNNRIQRFNPDGTYANEVIGGTAATGTNAGFNHPAGIVVGPDGLLYVADPYNNRIQVFAPVEEPPPPSAITYRRKISDPGGVAPLYPAGGTADGSGNRYVADSGGNRIVKLDPSGAQSTVSDTGFDNPRDVSLDVGGGSLWVSNTGNNQIVELGINGTTLKTFGGTTSYVKSPFGIANDGTGVYVADTYNNRIKKISKSDGSEIWAQPACDGALSRPRGVTVGSDGNIYATDTDNDRVVALNPTTGACLRSFGSLGAGQGQYRAPRAITSDGSGGLWVAEGGNYRVQHVTNQGAYIGHSTTGRGTGPSQFVSPACVFMDGGKVGVCDTFGYKIVRFSVGATGSPSFHDVLGGTAPVPGGFNEPFAVAYGPAGELYATDMFNNRVQKFDSAGAFERQWGGYGNAQGSFQFPRGVTVSPDGTKVIVTNSENNRIDVFQSDGTFVKSIKPAGLTMGWPHQTALANDGTYWVADTNNNRVLHIGTDGSLLSQFNGGGALETPRGIAIDNSGNLYVSNTGANKVEKYDSSGTLLATLATPGGGATNVRQPWNLAIAGSAGSEKLYVADGNNDRILVLTLGGAAVTSFGATGSGDGQFSSPRGVAVNPVDGTIAVADFNNNRISLWR